jgi:serine/threonine protein kinase/tetratricopeptide (TPR) repeat protein
MKMLFPGLSDSIASVIADPRPCPHCDSSSHIAGGLCVGCLLEAGLDPADEGESETLAGILTEINLPDQNWRLGNYEILEEIGRGGMGVIYRARQRHSRRIVAVKRVLSYHSDSRETLARFRREAQAAASLDHPNILPIYEVSESEDGLPFFSMKFAPGGTLQQAAPALRTEPRQCVAFVAKISRAVQFAHSRGILHRDLKPGNILLDARGEPLVSDFGLAKWLDTTSDLTRTLTIFGTPGYIAPEQASSAAAELKPTADIYSLGAILFDLLAGRPPFLGAHALSVIRQAAELPAPKLRTLSKLADRDLETICSRCLDRDPKLRYSSAHDLAEDLERWLEGRPIVARPVSTPVKIWRWSNRNRKLAAMVAAIIMLGGAGIVATLSRSRLSSIVQSAELAQRSVVLTDFEDLDELSTVSDQARGITEALGRALKATKGIKASRSSLAAFDPWAGRNSKRLGEEASSRFLLAGTVRKSQGKPHVVAHLIEAATGSVVSSWVFDADSYSEIAKISAARISRALGLTDTETESRAISKSPVTGDRNGLGDSDNPSACSYYARGCELYLRYNFPDLKRAVESFQKAVEIDPNFGKAYAMLASACQGRARMEPTGDWLERAEAAAAIALRLAPMLPESHHAYAGTLRERGHVRSSMDAYLLAYELNPTEARVAADIGNAYNFLGRLDLAVLWLEKAARRETRPLYSDALGEAWADLGEFSEAEKAYNMSLIFRPDIAMGAVGLSKLALLRGDYDGARKQCETALANHKDDPLALVMRANIEFFSRNFDAAETLYREAAAKHRPGGVDFSGSVRFLSALGFIRGSLGSAKEGRALLEEARELDQSELQLAPENSALLYSLAATKMALGETEKAFEALNRAVEAGWVDYRSMSLDPRFDAVRDTDAFRDVIARLTIKVQAMRDNVLRRNRLAN